MQVKGYSGARFKGSKTRQEAQAFVDGERKVGEKKPRRTAEDAEQETASKRQRTGDLLVERQVHVHINFDGGSRGNPGLAGAGAVVHVCWSDNGSPDDPVEKTIHLRYFMPGKHTNNAAEYRGLLLGLKAGLREVKQLDVSGVELFPHLVVRGDSRLIIEQLNGNYKCNSKNLQPFYEEVTGLFKEFETLRNFSKALEHVYRERNAVADGKIFAFPHCLHSGLNSDTSRCNRSGE